MQVIRIANEAARHFALMQIQALSLETVQVLSIDEENRKNSQNAIQWPILNAFADQLLWPVNGQMVKLTGSEWKDILTCAYRQEVPRVAMGLNGGMVMLGYKTREFKRSEWSDWIEFLNSVAVDRGVKVPVSKREAARYE